ncbi:Uncharacterised protein [Vibrio cholerae]|nr:Uncharacterised protein [Vibrio cholerae]
MANILTIGRQDHATGFFKCLQSHDGGQHFHSVVGGEAITASKGLLDLFITHHDAITAGTWVAEARTIRENFHLFVHDLILLGHAKNWHSLT